MLIKVRVENFKSFSKPTELTMISSSKIRRLQEHRINVRSTRLLKHAVIYGANAAGKSNLVEIFQFIQYVLQEGLPVQSSKLFCRTKEENAEKESVFELQFSVGDGFYAYGFSAILSKRIITSEWLYSLNQNGSSQCIFERENTKKAKTYLNLETNERIRFDTYSDDFVSNETSLFISELNRGKQYELNSKLVVIKKVYTWLTENIVLYTPNKRFVDLKYYYNDESLSKIIKLIQTFDTGISSIHIQNINMEEFQKKIPQEILNDVLNDLKTQSTQINKGSIHASIRIHNSFFNITLNQNQEYEVTTIMLKHGTSPYNFTFDEESTGSRRIFDLIDILLQPGNDVVFIIDELERSLHPLITDHFLKLFSTIHGGKKTQLIFTTHEASIMDQNHFRRDEFWFVDRDGKNESSIYSLDRFKDRFDKDINKAYFQGRYGAIPAVAKLQKTEVE